jgi:hypothetical protein
MLADIVGNAILYIWSNPIDMGRQEGTGGTWHGLHQTSMYASSGTRRSNLFAILQLPALYGVQTFMACLFSVVRLVACCRHDKGSTSTRARSVLNRLPPATQLPAVLQCCMQQGSKLGCPAQHVVCSVLRLEVLGSSSVNNALVAGSAFKRFSACSTGPPCKTGSPERLKPPWALIQRHAWLTDVSDLALP